MEGTGTRAPATTPPQDVRPLIRQGRPPIMEYADGSFAVVTEQPNLPGFYSENMNRIIQGILNNPSLLFNDRFIETKDRCIAMTRIIGGEYIAAQRILGLANKEHLMTNTMDFTHWLLVNGKMPSYPPFPDRTNNLPNLRKIAEAVIPLFKQNDKVLEVGSGVTNVDGHSFFMNLLPEELRSTVTPSDINSNANDLSPKKNIKVLDASILDSFYERNSLSKVVCSNLLERVSVRKLQTIIEKTFQVLQNDGLLIQLSDEPPLANVITEYFCNETEIYFPLLRDSNLAGIQIINKAAFLTFVRSSKTLISEEKTFLEWYAELLPLYRDIMHNAWLTSGKDGIKYFSQWIHDLQIPGMRGVNIVDFYKEKVTTILKNVGFEIVKFKLLELNLREGNKIVHYGAMRVLIAKKTAATP